MKYNQKLLNPKDLVKGELIYHHYSRKELIREVTKDKDTFNKFEEYNDDTVTIIDSRGNINDDWIYWYRAEEKYKLNIELNIDIDWL